MEKLNVNRVVKTYSFPRDVHEGSRMPWNGTGVRPSVISRHKQLEATASDPSTGSPKEVLLQQVILLLLSKNSNLGVWQNMYWSSS